MKTSLFRIISCSAVLLSAGSFAADSVTMNFADADGKTAGQITLEQTSYGLVLTPALTGLPPGLHGFHVHENPSCAAKEKTASRLPHWQPAVTTIRLAASNTARPGVMAIWVTCRHCMWMPAAMPVSRSWRHA